MVTCCGFLCGEFWCNIMGYCVGSCGDFYGFLC